MSITESEIRTSIFVPNQQRPGYLSLDRYCTIREVHDQFVQTLKSIQLSQHECNAFEAAEYLAKNIEFDWNDLCPSGHLVVLVKRGRCEGWLVEILIHTDSGEYQSLISAKYLVTDVVWTIGEIVSEACNNGLYN